MPRRNERNYRNREEEDNPYTAMIRSILQSVPAKEREAVGHVLTTEKARETYEILEENDIPERTIRRIMAHGVRGFAHGKGLTPAAYTGAIAEELNKIEEYEGVVEDMYQEGIISERQYEHLHGELEHQTKKRTRSLSNLEYIARQAAVYIFIIIGVVLMMVSATGSLTGAAVGTGLSFTPISFIIGFISFVAGLLLSNFTRE